MDQERREWLERKGTLQELRAIYSPERVRKVEEFYGIRCKEQDESL